MSLQIFGSYNAMQLSELTDGNYSMVTDDIDLSKNGYYQKRNSIWTYLRYNPMQDTDRIFHSSKNLYDGIVKSKLTASGGAVQTAFSDNDTVTSFIPVEFGKYYTISGIDAQLILYYRRQVFGMSEKTNNSFVSVLISNYGDVFTIYIDNPAIRFIVFNLTSNTFGTLAQAYALPIQVEEGKSATQYQPFWYSLITDKTLASVLSGIDVKFKKSEPKVLSNFIELSKVRSNLNSSLGTINKKLSPMGISYSIKGSSSIDSVSNNIFTQFNVSYAGRKSVYVYLMNYFNDIKQIGKLKAKAFTVPSGQLDNPDTLPNFSNLYSSYSYVHPSITYSATPIGGFKYWMVTSILPSSNMNDVVWEDEDVFVSNDAQNWQRIRSLYETDKTYTTTNLRLPPHSLATVNARKHALLPCPAKGDMIEISVPADNGGGALDRINITLTELPWKHDPFIFIDSGFVYIYNSYHLPYVDRPSGKNRFVVCIRTNDGINWDVVRTDGSTMRLTEASSRTIFTKDIQGRYNYMIYGYNRPNSNLEIVKYEEGDYELIYGTNFSRRYKGLTPYNFDLTTSYLFQDVGSSNHPTVILNNSILYLLNNDAIFYSTNRGQNFTKFSKYPAWFGGLEAYGYKKSACIGEGNKFILCDAERTKTLANKKPNVDQFSETNDINQIFIYEYSSISDFINKAENGLIDAYIDLQIVKVNYDSQKRVSRFYPSLSLNALTTQVNSPFQRIKIDELDIDLGDTIFLYVTLNSRNGAEIQFGGIDIT